MMDVDAGFSLDDTGIVELNTFGKELQGELKTTIEPDTVIKSVQIVAKLQIKAPAFLRETTQER